MPTATRGRRLGRRGRRRACGFPSSRTSIDPDQDREETGQGAGKTANQTKDTAQMPQQQDAGSQRGRTRGSQALGGRAGHRVACSGTPRAGRRGPEPPAVSSEKRPSRPHSADIEFTASLEADELRFDESPETDVRFFGQPGHESASGSDRTNLPEKVEPGVTYRNVRVDYRLANRLTGPAHPDSEQGPAPRPTD